MGQMVTTCGNPVGNPGLPSPEGVVVIVTVVTPPSVADPVLAAPFRVVVSVTTVAPAPGPDPVPAPAPGVVVRVTVATPPSSGPSEGIGRYVV